MDESAERTAKEQASRLCRARNWTLGELLGQGGSAAVFEVMTEHEPAALKVYFPRFIEGHEGDVTRKRLQIVKERLTGHACGSLVKIYAIDEFESAPFMVMERVAGTMLTSVLGLVPASAVEGIVLQIAQAAKFLEERGVTHRDIKSDNIIVDDTFTKATLVDVGVARLVDDLLGSGTDDDGKLPFVATARYSSPEYMFRLLPAGADLWRGLNFYQLGGLIHDLLSGEQLFEDVVRQSSGNRYLIAYAVATKIPSVSARPGVPEYLANLAQRCLQKDPAIRLANVSWEDLLGRNRQRENEALLGLSGDRISRTRARTLDLSELGRAVESSIDAKLVTKGLSCRHSTTVIDPTTVTVTIKWTPPSSQNQSEIDVSIKISQSDGHLILLVGAESKGSDLALFYCPEVRLGADALDLTLSLSSQAYDLFLEASVKLVGELGAGIAGAGN